MDAVQYLKLKGKMTLNCQTDCRICRLSRYNNSLNKSCRMLEPQNADKAVEIIEKWAEEHPVKTRMSDFIEKFPRATVLKYGNNEYIDICPVSIDTTRTCPNGECKKCKFKYWNEDAEDANERD